jgi:hypothetical protein
LLGGQVPLGISAKTGEGIPQLIAALANALAPALAAAEPVRVGPASSEASALAATSVIFQNIN